MLTVTEFMKKMLTLFSFEQRKQDNLKAEMFKFFVIFSRFEFSLKQSGYIVVKPEGQAAEPSWDAFVKKYKNEYIVNASFAESFNYLTEEFTAPNRQIVKINGTDENGINILGTTWKKQTIDTNSPSIKMVVDSIKLVRNNLFHGGKYGDESCNNPERTSALINHSINVIWSLAALDMDVSAYFQELV